MIVIVFGLPGSGKSFFASRLAKQLAADYVNSDQERIKIAKERKYNEEERQAVYNVLFARAKEAIQNESNLVIDATFYKQYLRQRYLDEMPDSVFFIEVFAKKSVLKKRLSQKRPFSEANLDVYKKLKKEWEPLDLKHLELESTNDNIGELLNKATLYLHVTNE